MEDLSFIIGKNLQILRKRNHLTQAELAEELNYSDKAVSKWEKGESLPPIEVFYKLSKMYGVSMDDIVGEEKIKPRTIALSDIRKRYLHITMLSLVAVWLIALILFVSFDIFAHKYVWQCFIWAVPVSFIVSIVFDAIWDKSKWLFWFISGLVWSVLLCTAVQFSGLDINIWKILLIGVPLQIGVVIWSRMVKK